MDMNFSSRLKNARLMRGLSMDELVERIDGMVSKQSISKYERGLMMPGSKVLLAISRSLQLPVDYFFRKTVQIGNISFREDYRMPISSSDQLIIMAQDKLERYLLLEDLLTIDSKFSNPLKRFIIQTKEDVEQAVKHLRSKWNLGSNPIFSVYEMLEGVGVKLLEFEAGNTSVMGFSTLVKDNIPLIVINLSANHTVERKRFTALHELGHLLLNFSNDVDKKSRERLCHCFAASVLCPLPVMLGELGEKRTAFTLDELISLKSRYGISVSAIVYRSKELGIITKEYYNQIYSNRINQNPLEEGWGGFPISECTDRFERLLQRAVAEQVISMSRAAELANEKLGDYRETLDVV